MTVFLHIINYLIIIQKEHHLTKYSRTKEKCQSLYLRKKKKKNDRKQFFI